MFVDVSLSTIGITPSMLAVAASAAEESGFDGVWVYDHLSGATFGGPGALDVWSALAIVTAATRRVGVGPLVVNVPARHPAHVAVAAATAQAMSGGRLRLGLGAGAGPGDRFATELEMLGLPMLSAAERRARVADAVGYLRALWSGAPSYEGTHYRLDGARAVRAPLPVPPIVVGANGRKMAAVAGAAADGVNVHDWQEDLTGVVAIAKERAAARGAPAFEASVECRFEPEWWDRGSAAHDRVAAAGVERVVLRWSPAVGLGAFDEAARHLSG